MEERVHPTPFRTRQLSSPSPMILHNVMWESRPPPKIVQKAPAASCAGAFSFFLLFLLLPSCLPIFRLSASQEGVTAAACGLFCCRRIAASARHDALSAVWLAAQVWYEFGYCPWLAASARRSGLVASRRGAGDRGLRSPLSPTTPYPALGQPSLSACMIALDVLLPPLCRAAYGNALPLSRLRRNERPGGVGASAPTGGDLLRAMPRLRFRSRMMGTGRHDERSQAQGRGDQSTPIDSLPA